MPFPFSESSPSAHAATAHVDTVLFDYGMVLSLAPDAAAWAVMLAITGLPNDVFHAAYWKFRHDYDRGALNGRDYWNMVANDTEIKLAETQIKALLAADVDLWTNMNQPMVDWAARLQRAGVRTGILSNIGDSIAEGIIARLAWLSEFNHCTWSYALLTAKPDPAIYQQTAQALNVAPHRILFIDDRQENIEAAIAVGMQAILYTTHADFEREMRRKGYTSLLDIGAEARCERLESVAR